LRHYAAWKSDSNMPLYQDLPLYYRSTKSSRYDPHTYSFPCCKEHRELIRVGWWMQSITIVVHTSFFTLYLQLLLHPAGRDNPNYIINLPFSSHHRVVLPLLGILAGLGALEPFARAPPRSLLSRLTFCRCKLLH
jgi:hypothetical protein